MEAREKKYVPVVVRFDCEGKMRPLVIEFDQGQRYPVDKILDVRRAACQSVGGIGDRYTCRIRGHPICGSRRGSGSWRRSLVRTPAERRSCLEYGAINSRTREDCKLPVSGFFTFQDEISGADTALSPEPPRY